VLSAANTGTPLTAEGVVALSTLRASAKRGGRTVGRFGVGFAAVSAVADDVVVCSSSGSVRFSRALTAQAVAAVPSLAVELASRGGRVPLLRLRSPPTTYRQPASTPRSASSSGRPRTPRCGTP